MNLLLTLGLFVGLNANSATLMTCYGQDNSGLTYKIETTSGEHYLLVGEEFREEVTQLNQSRYKNGSTTLRVNPQGEGVMTRISPDENGHFSRTKIQLDCMVGA